MTPIHPRVRLLMEKHAATPEQLAVLVAHHEAATEEDVEAAMAADEQDAYLDAVGWD